MIGGIEETSASFEARSAPRSYPTPISGHAMRRLSQVNAASRPYAATRSSTTAIIESSPSKPRSIGRRGKLLRDNRRVVGQRRRQQPKQEQHDREVHHGLQEREAHDVSRLQPEHTEQRQHPEWIDQVG